MSDPTPNSDDSRDNISQPTHRDYISEPTPNSDESRDNIFQPTHCPHLKMAYRNTTKHSSGEILTGRLWRKDQSFFKDLPYYSDVPRLDEIAGPLQGALGERGREGCYGALLIVSWFFISFLYQSNDFRQKLGKGLDEVHPFSDTPAVDVVLREAGKILSPNSDAVSRNIAGRIWGFVSKFVMLDRFCKTLGVAEAFPAPSVPKRICNTDYFGTASRVIIFLQNYLTLLSRFLDS
jgi:hypothetical protein